MLVVLPIPGEPCEHGEEGQLCEVDEEVWERRRTEMMMCGQLPSRAMTLRRSIVSVLPTMSSRVRGRCCERAEEEQGRRWGGERGQLELCGRRMP